MNISFALLAKFESPIIPLKDICQEYFGISPKTAEMKAKAQSLPVPTFKLRDSERAPTFVHVNDLASYIDSCHKKNKEIWNTIN